MRNDIDARKVDELGRIVIPIEIRRELDINEKDLLIVSLSNNKIILEKYSNQNTCGVCLKEKVKVMKFKKTQICEECMNQLKNIK